MPCRNGVCWRKGQRPPAAALYNQSQAQVPQPIAPGTAQPVVAGQISPQIEQMGQAAPNNLPVNQGANMAVPTPVVTQIPQQQQSWLDQLKNIFRQSPDQAMFFPTMGPEQSQMQGNILQLLGPLLQRLVQQGSQSGFAPIAQEETRRFHTETVPSIAERFTSLGAQRSSAFQGALGSAGAELGSKLGALGAQYGLKERALNQGLLSPLLSAAFQPQFQSMLRPGSPSSISQAAPYLGQLASTLALLAL